MKIWSTNPTMLKLCAALLTCTLTVLPSLSQEQSRLVPSEGEAKTLAMITATRDDFVRRVKSSGLTCTLSPPHMEVRPIASFGSYDADTNTVVITDWNLLDQNQKTTFFQMAGPKASEDTAHAAFEDTMHRSMLVHELAHWWEACHKINRQVTLPLFQQGMQADRIAISYWRVADPALPAKVARIAQGLIDHAPSPVPANQSVQEYFNRNYAQIPPPVRPWFGAQLYLAAYGETPEPSLTDALTLTKR